MLTSRILIKRTRIHTDNRTADINAWGCRLAAALLAARVSRGLVNPDV